MIVLQWFTKSYKSNAKVTVNVSWWYCNVSYPMIPTPTVEYLILMGQNVLHFYNRSSNSSSQVYTDALVLILCYCFYSNNVLRHFEHFWEEFLMSEWVMLIPDMRTCAEMTLQCCLIGLERWREKSGISNNRNYLLSWIFHNNKLIKKKTQ